MLLNKLFHMSMEEVVGLSRHYFAETVQDWIESIVVGDHTVTLEEV